MTLEQLNTLKPGDRIILNADLFGAKKGSVYTVKSIVADHCIDVREASGTIWAHEMELYSRK